MDIMTETPTEPTTAPTRDVGPAKPAEEWTPEDWLAGIDEATTLQPAEYGPEDRYEPDNPGFHEAVMDIYERRVAAHQVVTTLAELRRAVGHTQVQVAEAWGRPQPKVSRLEADPLRAEVATLTEYVRAIGGHLAIEAEVDGETYRYDLV
jgi:hypothetical protein